MPFDPGALPRLLDTFYPVVTPANLALARQEFPDWFGGGVLFGSKGDKLRLPDGREYDLILASGGPIAGRRWQATPIDPTAVSADDVFALEDGPLTLLEELVARPPDPETFTGILGQFVSDTRGMDEAYARTQRSVLDLLPGDPGDDLSAHEAAVIASQRADRASLSTLYATDELHAGDAVDTGHDGAFHDVNDVRAAHGALSPRIDDGRREIPVEPVGVPGDVSDHPRDWPHPGKEPEPNDPHR